MEHISSTFRSKDILKKTVKNDVLKSIIKFNLNNFCQKFGTFYGIVIPGGHLQIYYLFIIKNLIHNI